jgi:hypothetical protein
MENWEKDVDTNSHHQFQTGLAEIQEKTKFFLAADLLFGLYKCEK